MAEDKGKRYIATSNGVLDSWSGDLVYESVVTTRNEKIAAQRNSGHIEQYKLLEVLLRSFVATALDAHPLSWSIDVLDLGAAVVAADGTKIVGTDDAEAAAYVIRLAQQIELERYPDGRPSNGT